jgi:hypothetical protein
MNIAGGCIVGGDEETVARATAPAAKTLRRRIGADTWIERAEIDDAVLGLGIGEDDIDAAGAGRGRRREYSSRGQPPGRRG